MEWTRRSTRRVTIGREIRRVEEQSCQENGRRNSKERRNRKVVSVGFSEVRIYKVGRGR